MDKKIYHAYLGKNARFEFCDNESDYSFVMDASLGARNLRALLPIVAIGFFFNVFGLVAHYTTWRIDGDILFSKGVIVLVSFGVLSCAWGVYILFKLWMETRRCSWHLSIDKSTRKICVLHPAGFNSLEGQEWRPKLFRVLGNPIGAVKEDSTLLVVSTENGDLLMPLYSSLQMDFEAVSDLVLSLFDEGPEDVFAKKKISCTGIVELR